MALSGLRFNAEIDIKKQKIKITFFSYTTDESKSAAFGMHRHYRKFITVKSTPVMIFGIFVLFVLYYIGKTFYELAKLYQRSAWGFAILGVASYYMGVILGGILIALYIELFTSSTIDDIPDVALNLLAIPFGIASCWGTYRFLKKNWSKAPEAAQYEEVLDGNLHRVEQQP